MLIPRIMTDLYKAGKTVVLLLLLLLPIFVRAAVYLVSAGISDYPGYSMDLKNPANDARAIQWIYSKNAKNHNVYYKLLVNKQATVNNIVSAMNSLYANATENDIVVFYFSGHGFPGGFCAYDGEFYYDKIRQAMNRSRSKNKMIFADACFAGDMRTNGRHVSPEDTLALRKANVMLFLASRSNEYSLDGFGKNGLFTSYLQKGLRGNADYNGDRTITARELYNYVHPNVARQAQLGFTEQHPVMWGNFSDDMPVIVW